MALLRDSIVQGSLRVTDTTYTTNLNLSSASASLSIFTDANKNLVTKSAADAWSALGGDESGQHPDSYFIKAITSTDEVMVRFNSTAGLVQSSRMSINDNGLITVSYNGLYPGDTQFKNAAGTIVGERWLDLGNKTNVTSPRFYWRVWRPKATADTGVNTLYEQFRLPAASSGTAANATYEILTSKSTVTVAQGGTGADSAADARANLLAAAGNGRIFYGTCATAAATAAKVVVCAQYDGLNTGDVMIVTFTYTNTTNTALTMSIHDKASSPTKTTTAKDIKCLIAASIANIPAVGYLVAARPYMFVYDGTYWVLMNVNRDNNDNSIDRLYAAAGDGREVETAANGGIGLHRYSLEMMTANYKWSSIASKDSTATANTTDNNKVAATAAFLINSPILYLSTNTQAAAGGTKINVDGYTAIPLNLSYSTGTSSNAAGGLTLLRPVYLVGTIHDAKTFKLDTTKWWTQTLPASEDGKIYIYLGIAYNATNIYLSPWHPIYLYKGDSICEYNGRGISNITRSGTTFTATRDDGTTFTFTLRDNDTNTLLRTYASSTNLEVPLIGQNSAASATATWTSYTSGSKDWYGAIPATDANRIKINLSNGNIKIGSTTDASSTTGALYVAGGISVQKKLYVKTDLTVAGATTLNGKFVGSSNNYGATLPSSGQTTGQIFFQTSNPVYELPVGGTTGLALIKASNTNRDVQWGGPFLSLTGGTVSGLITMSKASSESWYIAERTGGNRTAFGIGYGGVNRGVYDLTLDKWIIYCDGTNAASQLKLYGAVWNDYAEFRKDNPNENLEAGRCISEIGDGSLRLTLNRLELGCEIVSDTFGFAIGQDKENGYNTPIASSGRVLAYPFEGIEDFRSHIGWPVCSGPNGTVSIMTEDEERRYPSRIIGTISEIPSYEEWGTDKVKVNGRVWIRIR